jgi:hypothetical protein
VFQFFLVGVFVTFVFGYKRIDSSKKYIYSPFVFFFFFFCKLIYINMNRGGARGLKGGTCPPPPSTSKNISYPW